MTDIDKWISIAKECKYLPENDLKVGTPLLFREPLIKKYLEAPYLSQ